MTTPFEVLRELVACKDLKEQAEALEFAGPASTFGFEWEAEFKPQAIDCREAGPGKGLCIKCANGLYEQCLYVQTARAVAARAVEAESPKAPPAPPPGIEGMVFAVAVGTNPRVAAMFDTHSQAHAFVAWLKQFLPPGATQEGWVTPQSESAPPAPAEEATTRMLAQAGTDGQLAEDLERLRQAHWSHWTMLENHVAATAVRVLRELNAWRAAMQRS